jgi:hypothetical protein
MIVLSNRERVGYQIIKKDVQTGVVTIAIKFLDPRTISMGTEPDILEVNLN